MPRFYQHVCTQEGLLGAGDHFRRQFLQVVPRGKTSSSVYESTADLQIRVFSKILLYTCYKHLIAYKFEMWKV